MTTFYRGPSARVTHKVFEAHSPIYREFAISGLTNVHIACVGEPSSEAVALKLYSAGGALAAIVVTWPALGSLAAALAIVITVTAASISARGCLRSANESYELHGHYGGTTQLLFATDDPRVFGQVRRALVRALEYRADTN